MKIIQMAMIIFGFLALAGFVKAEAVLEAKDLQGDWTLEYTKKSAASSEKIKREDSWSFAADKVTITHIPREGIFYDQPPVKYLVEDGKLKIALLGRSDKFDEFVLFEKSEKTLTLKGKFGDIYHFIRK